MPKPDKKGYRGFTTPYQQRRIMKATLKEEVRDLENSDLYGSDFEARIQRVKEIVCESGVTLDDTFTPTFVEPNAYDGVTYGLRTLVYSPNNTKQDLSLPWVGDMFGEMDARSLLKKLRVPKFMLELRDQTLKGISVPNTTGMLQKDGSPNKDLEMLTVQSAPTDYTTIPDLKRLEEEVIDDLAAEFLSLNGGKPINLVSPDIDTFRHQMSGSISNSTPGYPFQGFQWYDNFNEGTVFEAIWKSNIPEATAPDCEFSQAWAAAVKRVSSGEGFIFFQQARYTGDGGSDGNREGYGRQRGVAAAEACEKKIGKIISEHYKPFLKQSGGSGQHGIQAVSEHIQKSVKRARELYGDEAVRAAYWDVSKWDSSLTDERVNDIFFRFIEKTLDPNCADSLEILSNYKANYTRKLLITAFGNVRLNTLPSGCSITTLVAFIHHEVYLRVINKLVEHETGKPLLYDYGIQGDDFWGLACQWSPRIETIIKQVYSSYGCVIKGEVKSTRVDESHSSLIFLNEAIQLNPGEKAGNGKFPRWNFFWAESNRALTNGASTLDRMLLTEIKSRVAHPSPKELLTASWASKMDRFVDMPFYDYLLDWCVTRCKYQLSSWLLERVMPTSPTFRALQGREEERGIARPSDAICCVERGEDTYVMGEAIGSFATAVWLCSEIAPEARSYASRIVKIGRSFSKEYTATSKYVALDPLETVAYRDLAAQITAGFNLGYLKAAQSHSERQVIHNTKEILSRQEVGETIPEYEVQELDKPMLVQRTVARAALAVNSVDPAKFRELGGKAIYSARKSANWWNIEEDRRIFIEEAFEATFGIPLEQYVIDYERLIT